MVGLSLNSDGTRKDELPTSMTGAILFVASRRLVTLLGMKSASAPSLCRISRRKREGDRECWPS